MKRCAQIPGKQRSCIILNFIHTIFNLCGTEVVVNTSIQVVMNDIDLFMCSIAKESKLIYTEMYVIMN